MSFPATQPPSTTLTTPTTFTFRNYTSITADIGAVHQFIDDHANAENSQRAKEILTNILTSQPTFVSFATISTATVNTNTPRREILVFTRQDDAKSKSRNCRLASLTLTKSEVDWRERGFATTLQDTMTAHNLPNAVRYIGNPTGRDLKQSEWLAKRLWEGGVDSHDE